MYGPIEEVAIATADFEESFEFYESLGFETDRLNETEGFVTPSEGSISVYIFETDGEGRRVRTPEVRTNPPGLDHLSVEVDDADAVYEDLSRKGITVVKEPTTYDDQDIRLTAVRDPDGTLVYFVADV